MAGTVGGGGDCDDHNGSAHPKEAERCTDGTDNDCNGVADCADPACTAEPLFGFQEQSPSP